MRDGDQHSDKTNPTLEEDFGRIKALHDLRERADQLRKDSLLQLYDVMARPQTKDAKRNWVPMDDKEPRDLVYPALVTLAARRAFVRHLDAVSIDTFLALPLEHLNKADLNFWFTPKHNRVPTFQAARVLQACLTSPAEIFSRRSMRAYYCIVRELMTVGPDKRVYGAARAIQGVPSAFMTNECARALAGMARALRSTGELIEILLSALEESRYASKLRLAPKTWVKMENHRVALNTYSEIAAVARRAVVGLARDDYKLLFRAPKDSDSPLQRFCDRFCARFGNIARHATKDIRRALNEVKDLYKEEKKLDRKNETKKPVARNPVKDAGRHLGHVAALKALEDALALANNSIRASEAIKKIVRNPSSADEARKLVKEVASEFCRRSDQIGRLLETTHLYLQTVLDQEIERASTDQMNAGELVCAAATCAARARPETDRRVGRAAEILCRSLLWDGSFAVSSVLDTDEHGYSVFVVMGELHRAFAFLLDKSEVDIDPDVARRLVNYFDNSAMRFGDQSIIGWAHDQRGYPRQASRWVTALNILALDRITRMLDKTINRKIYRHFSVRSPKDLRDKPKLDKLFYPDYGLVKAGARVKHEGRDGESIAYYLERMRAHVLALEQAPDARDNPPCYALLLFGPPGTGKTTLIEAVAASSNVHYVEITPSDFLVEGDALIERRARDVFQCLSYLTRTVILFDEFDPMVRSREIGDPKRKLDRFAFLTPGMLPKLKALNESAKKRNTAYCLITNRIGTLDSAAIRSGRFDQRIGVYPPDLLSRAGRLAYVADKIVRQDTTGRRSVDGRKFARVVAIARGGGMTALGKPGNFSPPKDQSEPKQGSALFCLFETGDFQPGSPDAHLKEGRHGSGDLLDLEDNQWCWVDAMDEKFTARCAMMEKNGTSPDGWLKALHDVLENSFNHVEKKELAAKVTTMQAAR